jgi:hypothetical protein
MTRAAGRISASERSGLERGRRWRRILLRVCWLALCSANLCVRRKGRKGHRGRGRDGMTAIIFVAMGLVIGGVVYLSTFRTLRRAVESVTSGRAADLVARTFLVCLLLAATEKALSVDWQSAGVFGLDPVWTLGAVFGAIAGRLALVVLAFVAFSVVPVASLGRRSIPVCGRCGYNLKGQMDEIRCPECGKKYAAGACEPSRA